MGRADDLEKSQEEVAELQHKIESVEADLKEMTEKYEEKSKELDDALEESNSRSACIEELQTKLQETEESQQASISSLEETIETLQKENEELQTKVAESEVSKRIFERKQSRILKEMKSQLKKERAKQKMLEEEFASPQAKGSPLTSPRGRREASTASPASNNRFATPVQSPMNQKKKAAVGKPSPRPDQLSILQHDNEVLARRLGELKEQNIHLEEKVKFLHESFRLLHQDLEKKQTIITHYIIARMKKEGRITHDMEVNKIQRSQLEGIMAKMYRSAAAHRKAMDAHQEAMVSSQMETVLQETILKNIQLQNDIETLGNEIKALMEENGSLKTKMKSLIDEM